LFEELGEALPRVLRGVVGADDPQPIIQVPTGLPLS
jgi:hypothetical protein